MVFTAAGVEHTPTCRERFVEMVAKTGRRMVGLKTFTNAAGVRLYSVAAIE